MTIPAAQLWIDGAPRSSSTGQTFDVISSGTQAVVSRAARASSEDAVAAIEAASAAQPAWEATSPSIKRAIFLKAAELIQSPTYVQRVAETVQSEISATADWAAFEIMAVVTYLLSAAGAATSIRGEVMPSEHGNGGTVISERRPWGTVFAISPFNAPVTLAGRAVAVPIACGNTVVLKSSEVSPRCAEIVVEVLYEAGLPKNVLTLLHIAREDAPTIIPEIIAHKKIRHINFTGSDRVGKILAAEAAKYLKPCVFELGGKSAVVVLDDANVEEAARAIIYGGMYHGGQICMSSERILVQRGISKALISALTTLAKQIQPGIGSTAHIPPLFSTASAQNVIRLISDARSRGGEVVVGDMTHDGAFVKPHIVLGVEPGWPLWEQESFGPVFGVKIADSEDELVALANDTNYSLTSAVWTRDIAKGLRIGRKIYCGQVMINGVTFAPEPHLDVHGLGGATGYGCFDVEHFTERRTLVLAPPGLKLPMVNRL